MIIETETGVFRYSRYLSDEQIRCWLSRDRWHVHNRTENPADVEAMLLRLNTATSFDIRQCVLLLIKYRKSIDPEQSDTNEMNILVIGDELNLVECQQKFGVIHAWRHAKARNEAAFLLNSAELVFDFLQNPSSDDMAIYKNKKKVVFINTSLITLQSLITNKDTYNSNFFGFCGLPTFVNRELLEVSILKESDLPFLDKICKQLNTKYARVADSVGLVTLPKVRRMTDGDPLSVKTFERIRLDAADINAAVIEAARQALDKSFYWDNPKAEYRFQNHYHDFALKNYEAGMKLRSDNGESHLIFVWLEDEDVLAIGDSCGPNSFGNGQLLPEFSAKPKLMKAAQDKMDKIRDQLKLGNEDKLPTLGEILTRLGLTREQFIEASYTRPVVQSRSIAQTIQPPDRNRTCI